MERSLSDPEFTSEILNRTRDHHGVACFSEDPRGLLLWAHYAGGHTGICLQFDVTEDPGVLMISHRVKYRKEFPVLIWPRDREEVVDRVILSKGELESEKEVRYVSLNFVETFCHLTAGR
jgi:hypothetical protein